MNAWPEDELSEIVESDDLHIAPFREDGETYGTPTWIWSVRVDDDLYVRAYNGQDSSWYQAAVRENAGLTPARTGTIHDAYSRVVRAYNTARGKEPLTQRGMFNHLSKLVMLGFVRTIDRNKGAGGGQWNEHEFSDDVDIQKLREAFEEHNREWVPIDLRGVAE